MVNNPPPLKEHTEHSLSASERAYKFAPGEVVPTESQIRWWKLDVTYAASLLTVAALVVSARTPNAHPINHLLLIVHALLFVPLAVVVLLDLGPWTGDIGGTYPTPFGMKLATATVATLLNFLLLAWSNTLKTPALAHLYLDDGWRLALTLGLNTLYLFLFATRRSGRRTRH